MTDPINCVATTVQDLIDAKRDEEREKARREREEEARRRDALIAEDLDDDDDGGHATVESAAIDIPTEVVKYFMRKSGCQSSEKDFHRIVAFVTTHFLADAIETAKLFKDFKAKTPGDNKAKAGDHDSSALRMREVAKGLNAKNVASVAPAFIK